jgi:hypothetical protein
MLLPPVPLQLLVLVLLLVLALQRRHLLAQQQPLEHSL